jgi:hypothetical protein
MAWAHLLFFAAYVGLGLELLRATFKRRAALAAWRAAAGGAFDRGQHRFVTNLDLDGARLPEPARRLLKESRQSMAICGVILIALLALQLLLMVL